MTEVTFVASIQGHQVLRTREFAERVRRARRDITVSVVEGDAAEALLGKHKLKFGPAVVIDGRLEYVGIPRWRFLQERLAQVAQGLPNPRTAVPPEKIAPAKPAIARPTAATPKPTTSAATNPPP
jgi:hypothetical protein